MKISFYGAAQTVTGSQHLIQVNDKQLLLDCGLFQGRRAESYERNRSFPFKPRELDAVILSHAHIDHSGNLPNLIKCGFKGKIYTTSASADLAKTMLLDSGHIQEMDAEYLNRRAQRHGKRGEPAVEPLYTQADAALVGDYFFPVDYNQLFEPVPGVVAHLRDAGHILGSAGVNLEISEGPKKTRLWFSGDIGRRNLPILRDPVIPDEADVLIMESTYGDKPHRDPESAFEELRGMVKRTVERGGKVIVPAFAVGRTQEIVYDLHRLMDAGEIPSIPVFVDSPLAVNVSDIFRRHPECFDAEAMNFLHDDRHGSPLGFNRLTYIRSVDESKELNFRKDPMVIISASGMAETGRILHHLKNNIEDRRNTVLIVGWQAPYTLGRRLADREPRVKIFGEIYEVKAEVATIGGFSAHAGEEQLLEYTRKIRGMVKDIFLVHGEPKAAHSLEGGLEERFHTKVKVRYPQLGDEWSE